MFTLIGVLVVAASLILMLFPLFYGIRAGSPFRNKVALITGASRGLGFEIARQLCGQGANVVIIARDINELAKAKTDLDQLGTKVLTVQCDLLNRAQIESAVRETMGHFGKIDILINNAGIIEVGPLEHMQREDFQQSMGIHFWAPFELITQIIPHMRKQGAGRIVNIASIGGKVAVPHMAAYTASKFALVGLSDALRTELARENIYVTTVTPGLMRTGSEIYARFKGNHTAEFKAFAGAAKLPFASVSAERAARKILAAAARGQSALIMPLPARALIVASALFPNLMARLMKMMSRSLPAPVGASGNESRAGSDVK